MLLSNLALRPMEEISLQLDYWTAASEGADEAEAGPEAGHAERVSTKIEQIGQRMRNVEEVFSALKENLDQILGNLQDGILLFTGEAVPCWSLKPLADFCTSSRKPSSVCTRRKSSIAPRCWAAPCAKPSKPAPPSVKEEIRTETGRRIQASLDFIYDEETRQGPRRTGHAARS